MSNITNYEEERLLADSLDVGGSGRWLALFRTEPTDAVSGTELSGDGYARIQLTFSTPTQVGGKATSENDSEELFPEATADWEEAPYWVLFDASSGGNPRWWGAWDSPATVVEGQQWKVRAGDIVIDLD